MTRGDLFKLGSHLGAFLGDAALLLGSPLELEALGLAVTALLLFALTPEFALRTGGRTGREREREDGVGSTLWCESHRIFRAI